MDFNFARVTGWAASLADKAGALGALVSAMGCAMCFPALASIGAAVGLGFLSRWEGMFVNTLLPAFALLVIIAQAIGWLAHRQWHRSLAGMIGPSLVLMSLYIPGGSMAGAAGRSTGGWGGCSSSASGT